MERKLILCLGNPDQQYEKTRHNAGWLYADFLAERWQLPAPRLQRKFQALVTSGFVDNWEIIVAKPVTYMNDSGIAAAALVNFYRVDVKENFLLVLDDLDMKVGTFKLTPKLPRTHNGLASVSEKLGRRDFQALRIGVDDREGSRVIPSLKYVLMNFPSEQLSLLHEQVFPAAAKETQAWL